MRFLRLSGRGEPPILREKATSKAIRDMLERLDKESREKGIKAHKGSKRRNTSPKKRRGDVE